MEDKSMSGAEASEEEYLLLRIHVPDLNVHKCMQFLKDQLIWDIKHQCLAALPKELKESFNYGLFCPPMNGKAGKFLDEERRLGDYSFNGSVGSLELKYKRRVYKMLNLDEKQLKALHTRTNLRRLIDYVNNGQVEKITKMCSKGLDPNFQCEDTGETPLTIAATLKKPSKVLIALVNGGALLDYRTKDGSTAVHRAVECNSLEAVKTLLELGASPNYKDGKGLTPLYLSVTNSTDPLICETLLHDHATIGAQDLQGWQEVHQTCRNGLVQHLSHLLFYGADMNAKNASGNTPLHVCAVNNQESCARQLLFRGCDQNALNYANQTPYQVAVIAGNLDLAEVIQNYRPEDIVPFRGPPSYNPKRRSGINMLSQLGCSTGTLGRASFEQCLILPPSPCSSGRSSVPYSSASSSLSENSDTREHDNVSIVTVLAMGVADKSLGDTSDVISDSSGVGTSNSDTTTASLVMPGTIVVCLESYSSNSVGHLNIEQGDIIEVTGATDCGLLEGTLRGVKGNSGYFPAHCVQEIRLRHGIQPTLITAATRPIKSDKEQPKYFATAPRLKKILPAEPRTVVLHRSRKGFGFILRGAKATSPLMDLQPSERCPGLQYLDDVDKGGVADLAGLKKGDFLIAINNEDVSAASHEHVVDLIRKSGDLVSMTVISLDSVVGVLPNSKSTAAIHGFVNVPLTRQYATLPRKMANNQTGRSPAPLPPRRDPKTTLSVGRARARSMVAGLENGGEKEDNIETIKSNSVESLNRQNGRQETSAQHRTASIRTRPMSCRTSATELEELFQRQLDSGSNEKQMMTTSNFQAPLSPNRPGRVYASVTEMKRCKAKAGSKVRFFPSSGNNSELHRNFHSTPDLVRQIELQATTGMTDSRIPKQHRSQDDINTLILTNNRSLPPPTHPPPPPPVMGQVVKVDISRGDYDNVANLTEKRNLYTEEFVMSSFRPATSAKLYASPEDIKAVGYRARSLPSHVARPNVRKSQSMRVPTSSFKSLPSNSNPYAQPFKGIRSNSVTESLNSKKKESCLPNSDLDPPPPIPEPDYSLSESEGGDDQHEKESTPNNVKGNATNITRVNVNVVQNNRQSKTSDSTNSGNNSLPHSVSVEELQKVRTQLKSSKSYPNNFVIQEKYVEGTEDGDNSSSGVSSDQDVPNGQQTEECRIEKTEKHFRNNSNFMTLPSTNKVQIQNMQCPNSVSSGVLTRHAISLAQLLPPIEDDTEEKDDVFVPPPPDFIGVGTAVGATDAVLAPPPQFSDKLTNLKVRIVGAVPKNGSDGKPESRLHSQ